MSTPSQLQLNTSFHLDNATATISFQTCFASQTPCWRQFSASMLLCVEKGGNAPVIFPPFSMQRSSREASSWPCGSWIFSTPFRWCSRLVAGWSSSQLALHKKQLAVKSPLSLSQPLIKLTVEGKKIRSEIQAQWAQIKYLGFFSFTFPSPSQPKGKVKLGTWVRVSSTGASLCYLSNQKVNKLHPEFLSVGQHWRKKPQDFISFLPCFSNSICLLTDKTKHRLLPSL